MRAKERAFARIFSVACILVIWKAAATVLDSELILPPPESVLARLFEMMRTEVFWKSSAHTFFRVIFSFCLSAVLGLFLGILCGKSEFFREFLSVPISVLRSTPVVALILILLFALPSNSIPAAVSVLMSLPVVVSSVSSGFSLNDEEKKLFFMAETFEFSRIQKIRFLWIPRLKSFFSAAAVSSFGMSWKVVLAGEVLSLPKNALGTMLSTAQVHLETRETLAVAIFVIFLSFSIETALKSVFRGKSWIR